MLRLTRDYTVQARTASGVNILLGAWLIVSPWVFDYSGKSAALSSVTVGALIALLAAIRLASLHNSAGLSGINLLLAFWSAAAPWIYEYAINTGALWNNIFVGIFGAVLAVWSAIATEGAGRVLPTLPPGEPESRNKRARSAVSCRSSAFGEPMKSLMAAVLSVVLSSFASFAVAAELPFNQAQFDATRSAGRPVAVVFHADWCPTCRAQAPVLKELAETPALKSLTLYVANFDSEKALKRSLGVTQQSTIVVFKGGKEIARSTGDTQRDRLDALLKQAVS